MLKRKFSGSILDVLMRIARENENSNEWADGDRTGDDIGKFLVYSCCSFRLNSDKNTAPTRSNYLMIIKNNHTITFHAVNDYSKATNEPKIVYQERTHEPRDKLFDDTEPIVVDSDRHSDMTIRVGSDTETDTLIVGEDCKRVDLKTNTLKLRALSIAKSSRRQIHKNDLNLILEAPVKAGDHEFCFCALLQRGNKLTMFCYDPTELEYADDNETITLDNITIRVGADNAQDIFPSVTSVFSQVTLTSFSDVHHFLTVALKKAKLKLQGFDETEHLFETAVNNFRRVNGVFHVVNFEGLCINRCYLDENIVESFSSFSHLDDSIIDFFNQLTAKYVGHAKPQIMNARQKETWVIMSTFFLRKIRQYRDPREAYENTWKWTKKFKRPLPLNHFIFIPINLAEIHWSLVIVAHPKHAIRADHGQSDKKAYIIHLDSLGHHQFDTDICGTLTNYLYEVGPGPRSGVRKQVQEPQAKGVQVLARPELLGTRDAHPRGAAPEQRARLRNLPDRVHHTPRAAPKPVRAAAAAPRRAAGGAAKRRREAQQMVHAGAGAPEVSAESPAGG